MVSLRQRGHNILFDLFLVVSNLVLSLPGHRLRLWWLRSVTRATIGERVAIQRRVQIRARGGLVIGSFCNINQGVLLDSGGGLAIGDLVNISPEVLLLTTEHDPNAANFEGRSRPVRIGPRVWIASRAIVLPGSIIGEGAVVGAGSVVRGEVAPWQIVVGNPARVIGQRSREAQVSLDYYKRFLH
jgi:acetyltransferase-like isoleucine patch superfamily enzyme